MASPMQHGVPSGMAPGETQVPLNQQRSPVIMNVANYLRANGALKMRTGLLNNKEDIEFFRFKRLQRALLSEDYKKKSANPNNQLIPIPNELEVAKIFIQFILARLVVPVDKLHYHEIKQTKGWKPNKAKPTLRPTAKAALDPDSYYAWTYQKPNPYMLLYGFLMLAGVFTVILFPLWPRFMRVGVWYMSMGCLGLLGLFFAMAIVRLIIFIVTFLALPQAFWLYPNLFEDCGFFDSFRPVYAWSKPSDKKSKKKKKNAISKAAENGLNGSTNKETSTAKASGVEHRSQTQRRAVTLEEVDE